MRSESLNSIDANQPALLVVIHDCSSLFLDELKHIVEVLRPIIGTSFSAAVVPTWHGYARDREHPKYRDLVLSCDERLLHGSTHQSAAKWTPISLLTGRANEFSSMDETAVQSRLRDAQAAFRDLTGAPARGFLPPAWQLPVPSHKLCEVEFVMRFSTLEPCRNQMPSRSLATWSWDWGRIGSLGYAGDALGRFLHWRNPTATPCVAIHPIDVHHGFFPRALQVIRSLRQQGYCPTTASQLLLAQENAA